MRQMSRVANSVGRSIRPARGGDVWIRRDRGTSIAGVDRAARMAGVRSGAMSVFGVAGAPLSCGVSATQQFIGPPAISDGPS